MGRFVEVKTAELAGQALDWAVAEAEGVEYIKGYIVTTERNLIGELISSSSVSNYRPSTDWASGGPLRDKYSVSIEHGGDGEQVYAYVHGRYLDGVFAETALIALCRVIATAKLGNVAQVPFELVEGSK